MEDLIKEVRYLRDRQDIFDCVHLYSRGLDRHDVEILAKKVYHKDGLDEHGRAKFNDIVKFAEGMNTLHDAHYEAHQHHITNHNCDLDGDVAHCESYVIVTLLSKEPPQKVWLSGGRYIDRIERRDGCWKIALRTSVLEWAFEADGALFSDSAFTTFGFPKGIQSRDDPSYLRPLTVPPEVVAAYPNKFDVYFENS